MQNIVATVSFGKVEIDLRALALSARNCEYNPKRFSAVVMRNREATSSKTTALIFRSGKIVITGSKSEELAHTAAKQYSSTLKKIFPKLNLKM